MANMSFANNAATTLASGINTSVTSLTVASGTGTLFPTLTGSQYFYCTLESVAGTSREIVKVTARSTDTFTIARGQDGTTGTAFSTGDKVELRLVRANLTDFALLDEVNTFSQQQTFSSGIKFSDATTQTTAPLIIPGVFGQVFTASGTFTIPTGVTAVKVTVVGGGGSGTSLTGCCAGINGNTGGTSSVSSGTQTISTISATGGVGGIINTNIISGGSGSGGSLNITGGSATGPGNGAGSTGGFSLYSQAGHSSQAGKLYGGGGGASNSGNSAGGGGGSAIKYLTGLTSGGTLAITIGSGGAGVSGGNGAGAAGVVIFEW